MGWQDAPVVDAPSQAPSGGAAWQQAPLDSGVGNPASGADDAPNDTSIHFKSWGDLQDFRQKHHPEKAALSDQEFADWFGKSRAIPGNVTVGDRSLKDYAGLGARAVATGFDDLDKVMSMAGGPFGVAREVRKAVGLDTRDILDKVGLPKPATDNEKLVSAGIEGAAASAPFLGAGAPIAGTLAAGAASGAAGEGAKQAGYGPVTQFAVSLLAGAPFALAPAAARTATIPLRYAAENMGELGAETRASRILQEGASRPVEDITADIANRPEPVSGSHPTLAEVAKDPGLAGVERGHMNTAPPNFAAAMAERKSANAIARTRAASDVMGDGSPQAVQDYAAGELGAAERATTEQQAARQAAIDARLTGGRQTAAAAREEAGAGLTAAAERVGPTADRDATGAAGRDAYDTAYQAAKQRTREAYAAPVLNTPQPITIPREVFAKLRNAADEFYGDGGGEIPGRLQSVISDMADQHATTRTLTNIDRRLADFAGEARMSGRQSEAAFAERIRHDLGDFVQQAAPQEYRDALSNAKAVRAEQGKTFETGDVATSLARDRYGNPATGDNALPTKLVRPGAAGGDTADRLIAAVGQEKAEAIVREEMRRLVEEKGVETAAQARALSVRYGEVARRFPAVKADLQRIEEAAAAHDAAKGAEASAVSAKPTPEEAASVKERAALHDAILGSPLARLAGPEVDPSAFVSSLMSKADAGRQFQFLLRQTKDAPDAVAGVRRALGDFIVKAGEGRNVTAAGENIPSIQGTRKAIKTVVYRAKEALTAQQKNVLRQVSQELEQANFAATMAKPTGSDTRMNKAFADFVEMAPGVPSGTGSVLRKVLSLVDSGDQVKELLTQAVLDPDFAATLLKRPSTKHWAEIKDGMEKARKTLAATAVSRPIPANDLGLPARLQGAGGQSAVAADDRRDKRQTAK